MYQSDQPGFGTKFIYDPSFITSEVKYLQKLLLMCSKRLVNKLHNTVIFSAANILSMRRNKNGGAENHAAMEEHGMCGGNTDNTDDTDFHG